MHGAHGPSQTLKDQDYTAGQSVEYFRKPLHKDVSGWRGPATVVNVVPDENLVYVKVQGSVIPCAGQDVRPLEMSWFVELHQIFAINDDPDAP